MDIPSSTNNKSAIFCFGIGYTGQFLLECLKTRGWQVGGTVRDASKHAYFKQKNWHVYLTEGNNPITDIKRVLENFPYVIWTIPPDQGGHNMFLSNYYPILANNKIAKWVGYLSATSVYGDFQGAWVDEESITLPTTERGKSRLIAEHDWVSLYRKYNVPVHIFRLSAIYGPGRNALQSILSGQARLVKQDGVRPAQIFNRMHVADIVETLIKSMQQPRPGAVYNLADDLPTPPEDVLHYAQKLLGIQSIPEVSINQETISPMTRSFYQESKRVANHLIKQELGICLRYPTYRQGLDGIWHSLLTPESQMSICSGPDKR